VAEEEPTEASVREALRSVIDPEVGINVVDLGLVYGIESRPDHIYMVMTMTTPTCPHGCPHCRHRPPHVARPGAADPGYTDSPGVGSTLEPQHDVERGESTDGLVEHSPWLQTLDPPIVSHYLF